MFLVLEKEFVVKDVYEILGQKEMDCARLQKEIEALRLVIPLLAEEEHIEELVAQEQVNVAPDKTGTDGPFSPPPDHSEWKFWKRRRENER
jgi:hypothetical protein